jgi:hypothetical protein
MVSPMRIVLAFYFYSLVVGVVVFPCFFNFFIYIWGRGSRAESYSPVLKKLTFRTATRSPKHNFDLLLL